MKFLILKCFFILHFAFCILFLSGCEWSAGGGATTWNDRVMTDAKGNEIDFSGSYKSSDSGILVRKPGAGSSSSTNTTTITNTVSGELLGTGNGSTTAFSGKLANGKPIPGSLTIVVGGYRISDPGTASAGTIALTVTPADGSAGTLNLDTGVWTLSFPSPLTSGTQILAAYQYLSSTNSVISIQGNHGDPIYSFVVYQQGNTVQMIDNNNSRYDGNIGDVVFGDASLTQASAQFNATGVSQGYNVQIVGTLKKSTITVGGFKMLATFIEIGGYTADINGGTTAF